MKLESLTADEWYWLEGAAKRGAGDTIAAGLGTEKALEDLAEKCARNEQVMKARKDKTEGDE